MAARSFDVVILGGGNAGMGVTVATREAGLKVAMIDRICWAALVPIAAACRKRC